MYMHMSAPLSLHVCVRACVWGDNHKHKKHFQLVADQFMRLAEAENVVSVGVSVTVCVCLCVFVCACVCLCEK